MCDECGIFDDLLDNTPDWFQEVCDRAIARAVENRRAEWRRAWEEYISEYSD